MTPELDAALEMLLELARAHEAAYWQYVESHRTNTEGPPGALQTLRPLENQILGAAFKAAMAYKSQKGA